MNTSLTTSEETRALESPSPQVLEKIELLFPLAFSWYQSVEAEYISHGRALSDQEIVIARKLGVTNPENVRIVVLTEFPLPSNSELLSESRRFGFGSTNERGRTNGYVIMLKPEVAQDATVIAHELVHVSQVERLGRRAFVKRYLLELEVLGYARSPLELEAYGKQATV